MTAKSELRAAVLLVLLGAGLLLVSAGRVWLMGTDLPPAPLPPREVAVDAGGLGSPVSALALVVLAGVPALAATRSSGRVVVGVLLAVAGAAASTAAARVLLDPAAAASSAPTDLPEAGLTATGWPAVAVAGGLFTLLAGGLVAVRGRRWAELGRRYEAPAARATSGDLAAHRVDDAAPADQSSSGSTATPVGEAQLWDALDRGEDPTRS